MTTTTATAAHPRRLWNPVQRDAATLLESTQESGGERSLFEVELSPTGKNMPHRHLTYAEHFTVLEGTLTVELADGKHHLGPGEEIVAPAGAVHNFLNEGDEDVRYLVELRPGHRGFERGLQIAYGMAADGRLNREGIPRNPLVMGLLAELGEVRLTGAYRLLEPLFGVLARIARARGIDRELEERYVRW